MSHAYLIAGSITNEDGKPLQGLMIKAFDVDLLTEDDFLGQGETATDGSFTILYRQAQFVKNVLESFTEGGPDIVLTIYDQTGQLLHTTKRRAGAARFEKYTIQISDL
ncbi:MAG: hypothetical protein DHS20C17_28580 [Cyclobacteriaceae bacterium]|nr:MAG: hypothetical protein DHS20C17_28580 [Cyclobacteriaceae bacterium]